MANGSFDVALGREVELYNRVLLDDPLLATLMLVVLANGVEADSVLRSYETLAEVLSSNDEVSNSGYNRIVLYSGDISAYSIDHDNHRIVLPLVDQTFPTIDIGDSWRKLLLCFDSNPSGGTDSDVVPIAFYDMLINGVAVVPNGNDIIVGFGNGLLIAS